METVDEHKNIALGPASLTTKCNIKSALGMYQTVNAVDFRQVSCKTCRPLAVAGGFSPKFLFFCFLLHRGVWLVSLLGG